MLYDSYILEENVGVDLYKTESIRNFNKELSDNLFKNIEKLEGELLSLTDLLAANGDLLQGSN
jgi:hypothetical protein